MKFDWGKQEYIAKSIGDIGKALLTVGFASYFFEKFPVGVKIYLISLCVVLLVTSVLLYPVQKKGASR